VVISKLKSLTKSSFLTELIPSPVSIPQFPNFNQIKIFIDQLKPFYFSESEKFLSFFISKLIPFSVCPLKYSKLSKISIFSCRVYLLNSFDLRVPFPAHVDGNFNFFVDLKDNIFKVPVPENCNISEIEYLLHEGETQQNFLDYFPKISQNKLSFQLHTFIEILNGSSHQKDFYSSFLKAVTHPSLSFAIAIAIMSRKKIGFALMNILIYKNTFDYFLRCLACSLRENIYLAALSNLFFSLNQKLEFLPGSFDSVESTIESVCSSDFTDQGKYLLKAVLSIAAYQDSEELPIHAFLDVVVIPLLKYNGTNYSKKNILNSDKSTKMIRNKILSILRENILVPIVPEYIEKNLMMIHEDIYSRITEFLKIITAVNAIPKTNNCVAQMLLFIYKQAIKHNL
jgi:hypothetical protein